MKKLTLSILIMLQVWCALAQRNPHKEILVFFAEGTSLETRVQNGKAILQPAIKSEKLKQDLSRLGLNENSFEPANPRFVESDTLKIMADGTRLRQLNMTKLYRLRIDNDGVRKKLIEDLNALPEVLYAEQNGTVTPYLIPSDDRFDEQWGLRNTVFPGRDIHAEQAWDIFTGEPNNIIAIVDGGIDVNHEDLNDKVTGGDTGFGWGGHGIHVAGIAAAESDNEQGISGVDWNAQIHAQRIDNVQDDVDTYNAIVDAVDFSSNVQVLNHSWGLTFEDETPGRNSLTVRQAFAYAYKANRTSVVAMGNHQETHPDLVAFPAGFGNVIAVGASNIEDVIADFSARGNHVDVAAPGVNILSTFTGGGYANDAGTSMATPHVSGIASLLKGFNPTLANDDIENIIRLSADDLANPPIFNDGTAVGFDQSSGAGRANAERALNFLRPPFTLNHWTVSSGNITNSTGNLVYQFLGAGSLASGNYIAKRHEVRRAVTFPNAYCQVLGVWGRGVTTGWSIANPNYGEGFCEVVPGTLTNTSATLRTYVYEIVTILGQTIGWYPTTPGNVTFAYTVLGIEGPNTTIAGDFPPGSCSNSTQTFSLSNPTGGTAQIWTVSNGLQIIGSNSGTSVVVRVVGNGNQWIQASITNMCNTQTTVIKTVSVGIPQLTVTTYDDRTPQSSNYTYHTATAQQVPGTVASNYRWFREVNGLPTIQIATGLQLSQWPIPPCSSRYYQLQVTTACGTAVYHGYAYNYYGCGYMYSTYPNPATETLTIERRQMKSQSTKELTDSEGLKLIRDHELDIGNELTYNLYNQFGERLLTTKNNSTIVNLDIKNFPDGIYVLKIVEREKVIIHRIIINK